LITEGYKEKHKIKRIYTQDELKKFKLKAVIKLFTEYKELFLKSDNNIKNPLISLILFMQSRLK